MKENARQQGTGKLHSAQGTAGQRVGQRQERNEGQARRGPALVFGWLKNLCGLSPKPPQPKYELRPTGSGGYIVWGPKPELDNVFLPSGKWPLFVARDEEEARTGIANLERETIKIP